MSYQIITYSPDTGGDEHGDYRTQREARQALKQYRQEAGVLIYDLDRWRIVYQRPQGRFPSRGGATLDYPVYPAPPLDDYLGDG